jgi:hypothetical protein
MDSEQLINNAESWMETEHGASVETDKVEEREQDAACNFVDFLGKYDDDDEEEVAPESTEPAKE